MKLFPEFVKLPHLADLLEIATLIIIYNIFFIEYVTVFHKNHVKKYIIWLLM